MRREERVTVQGPVKKQQPDGMSHRGAKPLPQAIPCPCPHHDPGPLCSALPLRLFSQDALPASPPRPSITDTQHVSTAPANTTPSGPVESYSLKPPRWRAQPPDTGKFLFGCIVRGRHHNQLITWGKMYAIARQTGRTLVMPNFVQVRLHCSALPFDTARLPGAFGDKEVLPNRVQHSVCCLCVAEA